MTHSIDEAVRIPCAKSMHSKVKIDSLSVVATAREYDYVERVADGDRSHVQIDDSVVSAGNVGTHEGVRELENAGADAKKVGIGPGRVCITKIKTGFGTGGWQLAALNHCSKAARKPIIADGGIRTHGDIAKS